MKSEKVQFENHNYKPDDCKTVSLSRSTKDPLEIIERIKEKMRALSPLQKLG